MNLYDELIEGAIDIHCHIDFEFSAKERKREPEFQWLPKAEAMGVRGVVLKSHWWPTVNVVPYILAPLDTKVTLWSSVALNITARNDVERKGFSHRIQSYYKNHTQLENPNYYFLDDKGKLTLGGREIIESCREHELTLGMGHVSWQESLAFIEAAREMRFNRIVVNHAHSPMIAMPLDAMKRAAELGAFVEVCWNALAPGRMDSPQLVEQLRAVGLRQVVASTDYFRPYSPNPPELMRMFLGMLYEGGLSKEEVKLLACTNPARLMGMDYVR
jgi:hypothetical protein